MSCCAVQVLLLGVVAAIQLHSPQVFVVVYCCVLAGDT
jgi:hypothetical protein